MEGKTRRSLRHDSSKMRGIRFRRRYASRKEKVNHILPFSRVSIVRVENRTFLSSLPNFQTSSLPPPPLFPWIVNARRGEARRDAYSIPSLSLRNSFSSRASRCLEQRAAPHVSLVRKTSLDGKVNARVSLPRDLSRPMGSAKKNLLSPARAKKRFYRRRKLPGARGPLLLESTPCATIARSIIQRWEGRGGMEGGGRRKFSSSRDRSYARAETSYRDYGI